MANRKTKPKARRTRRASISDRIEDVTDVSDTKTFLLYGESNTGKTHIAGTFPKPILILDIKEKGTETVRDIPGIKRLRINHWTEFWDEENTDPDEVAYWMLAEGTDFKTIVIDQVTNLQDMCMAYVREKNNKKSDDRFTQPNWGQLGGYFKNALGAYKDLEGCHNVWIAHERVFSGGSDEEDDNQIDPAVGARVIPSISSYLNGASDVIGNTFVREYYTKAKRRNSPEIRHVEYCLRLGPHGYRRTKIRRPADAGLPPEYIIDPSFEKIMEIVSGKKPRTTKRRTRNAKS